MEASRPDIAHGVKRRQGSAKGERKANLLAHSIV